MEKFTKRNIFEALITLTETGKLEFTTDTGVEEVSAEALREFAENELALLDKKAIKAKERAAVKKAESDSLLELVAGALTEDFEPIADIAARIEGEDVTVAKVTYRLTQLVKNGEAEKEQITVPGGEGQKARKIMAYKLIG